jgi:hypothetical protein
VPSGRHPWLAGTFLDSQDSADFGDFFAIVTKTLGLPTLYNRADRGLVNHSPEGYQF